MTVGLAAVGDEISRWPLLGGDVDRGLRGGRVRFAGGATLRIRLTGVRWVTNAVIDGTRAVAAGIGLGDGAADGPRGPRRRGPADRPVAGLR